MRIARPTRVAALLAIATSICAYAACTNTNLQPPPGPDPGAFDNELAIEGEFCTSAPTDLVFPVHVGFIVDTSGSMQFTDPSDNTVTTVGNPLSCQQNCINSGGTTTQCQMVCSNPTNPGRQAAVQAVINRFANNPQFFAFIEAFNGRPIFNGRHPTEKGYTNSIAVLNQGIASLAEAEITTDYQGALAGALLTMQQQLLKMNPADIPRSKFIMIFLSDGAPNPECEAGCGNDNFDPPIPGINADWCDVPADEWCDEFNTPPGPLCDLQMSLYPEMRAPCLAYNTDDLIIQKVLEMKKLAEDAGVSEFAFHTAFLYRELPTALKQLLVIPDRSEAEPLLQKMAAAGGGEYRSFADGQAIDFLNINYTAVQRPLGIKSFAVSNTNALPALTTLDIDTDGDGLSDDVELDLGSDILKLDTDGDGYNDKLEADRTQLGFDPTDPAKPARLCTGVEDQNDEDGDGLRRCEEVVLGTNPRAADSDRDAIDDRLEFLFGSDPRKNDALDDPDFDEKLVLEEILNHTDPTVKDPVMTSDFRYIYDLREKDEKPDRTFCTDFRVSRVRLVTTKLREKFGTTGYNEIELTLNEGIDDPNSFGNQKIACVRARYVEGAFKDPADGKVSVKATDFYPLRQYRQLREAAKTDPTKDPCVGVPLP